MTGPITPSLFHELVADLQARGFGNDVAWSDTCGPPKTADDFAAETIFVICNGGCALRSPAESTSGS
jgi:hypothetical protein